MPLRTGGMPLNYSALVAPTPTEYLLGPGDLLEITVPDLIERGDARPFQSQILGSGDIHVPRVGPVPVGGLPLADAQVRVNAALANGILENPRATVTLVQKATVGVLVLGAVQSPGIHALPRYEHDVAHALAASGGFTEDAADVIEIHRRSGIHGETPAPAGQPGWPVPMQEPRLYHPPPADVPPRPAHPQLPFPTSATSPYQSYRGTSHIEQAMHSRQGNGVVQQAGFSDYVSRPPALWQNTSESIPPAAPYFHSHSTMDLAGAPIIRIPLRGDAGFALTPGDVVLYPGDVLVVPDKQDEIFFVVGPLSQTNRVRFSVGDQDREIGSGFLLPPDREIDVVTAVAMAGYIDPIESPTTVTVHRVGPDGMPLLIRVDLINARSDPRETVFVQAGDIIYLNPDGWWYSRRLFDRVISGALSTALGRWLTN